MALPMALPRAIFISWVYDLVRKEAGEKGSLGGWGDIFPRWPPTPEGGRPKGGGYQRSKVSKGLNGLKGIKRPKNQKKAL